MCTTKTIHDNTSLKELKKTLEIYPKTKSAKKLSQGKLIDEIGGPL
jgi:hypothetical protein